jgi:peptidyl-dipeptidase A
MRINTVVGLIALFIMMPSALAQPTASDADRTGAALRDAYLAKYKPLWLEAAAAWWEANLTGADAAYARKKAADRALVDLHSDHETFARLKELKDKGQIADPVLRRELDVMYRTFLPGQADPASQKRIVELENDVEQIFNTYRSRVGEKSLSENEVRDILANTTSSAEAEAAWKAYMGVGRVAESKLRELIELRNRTAHELGFSNYYSMRLVLQEVDETELMKLFDELDELTRAPFAEVKTSIDAARAARFHVPAGELRPWHFGDLFFQEVPENPEVNLDAVFEDADLLALARKYYTSIGLPVEDILARSDLHEKPGKCPHAFCHDMNRAGDVRILTNLKPNVYWADTLLHELGHAVYDLGIDPNVPFLLRTASSGITTEGVAEMFGACTKNEEWLREVRGLDAAEAARIGRAGRVSLRTGRLMFSRWAQVMVRFERTMYADPSQDLARLWWDLKQRYQLLNPPDRTDRPDYAAKVHILTTPAYYHSYLLGELFAAQVRAYVAREVLKDAGAATTSFFGKPEAGTYLRQRIFAPGSLYSWNELTRRATGEALLPKYFAAELAR